MLPWVCTVKDHRRRQDIVKIFSDTLDCPSCATFLVCCHILTPLCDLSLNRPTAGDVESISSRKNNLVTDLKLLERQREGNWKRVN